MIVFLNGQFVPEEQAQVSVFDRGFLYGDGLFETLRVYAGRPFRWAQHLDRLKRGADFLNLRLPIPPEELKKAAGQLIQQNQMPECILRLTVSRGVGPRGYSPRGAEQPVVVMSVHPAPVIDPQHPLAWHLATSSIRVPAGAALANFKTCDKLVSVLARAEAEAQHCEEALLLNTKGEVAEAWRAKEVVRSIYAHTDPIVAGEWVHHRLDEARFRRVVAVLLLVAGGTLLFTSLKAKT